MTIEFDEPTYMRKLTLATLALSIIFLGAGCFGPSVQIKPVTLEYWRIDDSSDVMDPAIEAYQKDHPNVTINVRSYRADEYETSLLEALAEDRGPDIFSIPNVWLPGWKAKLLPLPEKTTIATQVVDPAKKQIVAINQESKSLTKLDIKNKFVEAVESDVVMLSIPVSGQQPTEQIWGLPYSVDTLAMFYNVALLKQANFEEPPQSWKGLQEQTKKLTVLNEDGTVKQSGVAIGTARNVRHYTDLLSSIMIQNGTIMADENGSPSFNKFPPANSGGEYPPGVEALIFYQSFGRPGLSTYTWDSTLPDSMDAFIAGKTALYFGYPYDRIEIAERAPQLNFEVAKLPQVNAGDSRNIAHYPVEVVSKKTMYPNEAWDFIQFASSIDGVREYLRMTNRPTALRALITEQITDPEAKPYVSQVLNAETWYRGVDWSAVESAFETMINTYPTIEKPSYTPIVSAAVSAVNSSLR